MNSDSRLPRSPEDPDNLRRLREEAVTRLEAEERRASAPVYGGPPPRPEPPAPERPDAITVYGGPPLGGGGPVSRRGLLWGLILAALAALGALIAWLIRPRKIFPSSSQELHSQPAPVYGGPPIRPQPPVRTFTGAIVTANGHFLSAVNGGGLGDSNSASSGAALSTGATRVGPNETFTLVWVDEPKQRFALKTRDGHFVTAVNGGGIAGADSAQSPIHTDRTRYGRGEEFTIMLDPESLHATIRTSDGAHYLSAVKGGGVGGSNRAPIRTNATQIVPEAVFHIDTEILRQDHVPPAAVYGGPALRRPG